MTKSKTVETFYDKESVCDDYVKQYRPVLKTTYVQLIACSRHTSRTHILLVLEENFSTDTQCVRQVIPRFPVINLYRVFIFYYSTR